MTTSPVCSSCGAQKAPNTCELCNKSICKNCLEHVDSETFSFFTKLPAKLKKANFCPLCYDAEILPEKVRYGAIMERAKDVYFLTKAYPGYIRVLRRHTKRVSIPTCDDRKETILRMAFMAAELNFNAIIEAEVLSRKIRKGDYQSSLWAGSAMPALIDGEQLERTSLKRI